MLPRLGGTNSGLDHTKVNSAAGSKAKFVGIEGMTILEDVGRSWMCGLGCPHGSSQEPHGVQW